MGNPWLAHVKTTMKKHKGKSFKTVLTLAKKTYKKVGHTKKAHKRKTHTKSHKRKRHTKSHKKKSQRRR